MMSLPFGIIVAIIAALIIFTIYSIYKGNDTEVDFLNLKFSSKKNDNNKSNTNNYNESLWVSIFFERISWLQLKRR